MNTLLKQILDFLYKFTLIRFVALYRANKGALGQMGWTHVRLNKLLVSGPEPKPWFVYGAIDYIEHTINPFMRILELGGGGSTPFWLNRGHNVVTIETDPKWLETMNSTIGDLANWKCHLVDEITSVILEELELESFDVIVNDFGGDRAQVAEVMMKLLNKNGYIIWDNSDRKSYQVGIEKLISNGFGFVSFFGLGPINAYASETSIFSKQIPAVNWPISSKKTTDY